LTLSQIKKLQKSSLSRRHFVLACSTLSNYLWPTSLIRAEEVQKSKDIPNLTIYLSDFICRTKFTDIPPNVLELGKKSILDGLGLAISGNSTQLGSIVKKHLNSLDIKRGSSTIIGSKLKVAPRFAAFANGVDIHADDYDDTQLAERKDRVYGLLTHPTAPVLPAVLAIAEKIGASGSEAMLAYQVGVEVECKIAEAIDPRHYQNGFHSTGTCGPFGAAAAVSKLLRLDVQTTARALSIAGSQAAGLRENFGTMTKPFHAGKAAENGLVAAQFAALGWTAAESLLEAPRGFFFAAGGGYDASAILEKLGQPWTFEFPGVSIKPHPSGSLTHPAMTKMLQLIRDHHLNAKDVLKVTVGTNKNMPNALIHHRPKTELQAKFSMEFCMAILLIEGHAGLAQFTTEVVNRPDVQEMIEKIDFVIDPQAEAAGYDKMTSIIKIELNDGRVISGQADFGAGSPANPMTYEQVASKFMENAEYAKFPTLQSKKIISLVQNFETIKNINHLSNYLGIS
jgi:2-methylcitrate dehydratase PrpD